MFLRAPRDKMTITSAKIAESNTVRSGPPFIFESVDLELSIALISLRLKRMVKLLIYSKAF